MATLDDVFRPQFGLVLWMIPLSGSLFSPLPPSPAKPAPAKAALALDLGTFWGWLGAVWGGLGRSGLDFSVRRVHLRRLLCAVCCVMVFLSFLFLVPVQLFRHSHTLHTLFLMDLPPLIPTMSVTGKVRFCPAHFCLSACSWCGRQCLKSRHLICRERKEQKKRRTLSDCLLSLS